MQQAPTYHDLFITTAHLERTSIFNLPHGYLVTCTRAAGWELRTDEKLVAGEFMDAGLRLDIAGHVIVDNLNPA